MRITAIKEKNRNKGWRRGRKRTPIRAATVARV